MTLENINDKDMQHCHFLKSTCSIGGPPSRAPLKEQSEWTLLNVFRVSGTSALMFAGEKFDE